MNRRKIFIYKACKVFGLFAWARWATRKSPKILCYHGFEIQDEATFRPMLFMSSATFERRMALLERLRFNVVSLDKLVADRAGSNYTEDTVVITVDDGFESFFKLAVPVLVKYRLPATVYVTTYYVEKARPVYRLMIQYLLWKASAVSLDLGGLPVNRRSVNLGSVGERTWLADVLIEHGETQCDETERDLICRNLARRLGIDYESLLAAGVLRLMTPEQLRLLSGCGVDVGLHTHRHRFPDQEVAARMEIEDNRRSLAAMGVPSVEHFCYPSGEYVAAQWAWLSDLGVKSSTTCRPGLNQPHTSPQELRRYLDGEDSHDIEFEAALCGFSDILRRLAGRN